MAVPSPSPEPKTEEPPQPVAPRRRRLGENPAGWPGHRHRHRRGSRKTGPRRRHHRNPCGHLLAPAGGLEAKRLTIRGVGERPVMMADGASADDKAIWVIADGEFDIENIEFRGARVADGNGAGIRFEHGTLRIRKCAFFRQRNGHPDGQFRRRHPGNRRQRIRRSPRHRGDLHHLLYVGAIGKFTLVGSQDSPAATGATWSSPGPGESCGLQPPGGRPQGQASYELEFPNGGVAYVIGNLIGQSAETQNPTLVSYGAEGPRWPDNALYLVHNTLTSEFNHGNFLFVWSDKFRPDTGSG